MDTLYIGNIPSEYCYADFGSDYIDLYNTNVLQPNNTYTYYRVYLYDNAFFYEDLYITRSSYSSNIYLDKIDVTDNIRYRRDFPDICSTIFIYCILFIFLVNLVTSSIKKGGMLGGLF